MTSQEVVMQRLTLQSRIHFSRALLPAPAMYAHLVCCSQMWPRVVFWLRSKPATRHAGLSFLEGALHRSNSAGGCALPGATYHEPLNKLQIATTHTVLGSPSRGQAVNWGQLLLVPGLGLLSKKYREWRGQILLFKWKFGGLECYRFDCFQH